jgi:2-oxoglutarate ferredoxin oxidoreductase subunit alpha
MDLNIKIGGAAGAGVKSVGMTLGKTFSRLGLKVFEYSEYPSLIRGGHNTETIHVGSEAVYSQIKPVDILMALDKNTLDRDVAEVRNGGTIIFDEIAAPRPGGARNDVTWVDLPMLEAAKNLGNPLLMNTVGVGAIIKLVGLPLDATAKIIAEEFSRKGQTVIDTNLKALEVGYQAADSAGTGTILKGVSLEGVSLKDRPLGQMLINGSEAAGLGAIAAGLGLYAAYPMTPASPLLHFLAAHQEEFGYVVRQPEDEIAAANMVIGAMHTGVRAMSGTSGGGFALMNETLALSAMTETPLVIYVAQRPGPATGLPTWTEQGELMYAIYAGHGEFLRFVLAPGDPREMFLAVADAFNLAERYQAPIIILTDKYLAESAMTIDKLDLNSITLDRGAVLTEKNLSKRKNYQRYELTGDGISPRSLPGTAGGVYTANSDEHEYHGLVDESSQMRLWQQGKRLKKIETAAGKLPGPKFIGDPGAETTIITWGSTKMPACQSMATFNRQQSTNNKINVLHFSYLWPMNREAVNAALKNIGSKTLIVENNAGGQFESLLKLEVGFVPTGRLRKFDGRPMYPEEIISAIDRLA